MNHDFQLIRCHGWTEIYRCTKCGKETSRQLDDLHDEDYLNTHSGECSEKLLKGKKHDTV